MTKILPLLLFTACTNYTGPQKIRYPSDSLFGEKCIERKDLHSVMEAVHAAVVESCIETKLCTKKPIGRYWVCLTECRTHCGGRFKNSVHGCAGSNAIYVAIGPWSFKSLLAHEMLKNLVVSRFTVIPWDTSDRDMSLDLRFRVTEMAIAEKVRLYHDATMACVR